MPAERQRVERETMDVVVGYILLAGVLTSLALVAAGIAWHWMREGNPRFTHLSSQTLRIVTRADLFRNEHGIVENERNIQPVVGAPLPAVNRRPPIELKDPCRGRPFRLRGSAVCFDHLPAPGS